jgi:hypothetical protein
MPENATACAVLRADREGERECALLLATKKDILTNVEAKTAR